jgi:hypothetical protein
MKEIREGIKWILSCTDRLKRHFRRQDVHIAIHPHIDHGHRQMRHPAMWRLFSITVLLMLLSAVLAA